MVAPWSGKEVAWNVSRSRYTIGYRPRVRIEGHRGGSLENRILSVPSWSSVIASPTAIEANTWRSSEFRHRRSSILIWDEREGKRFRAAGPSTPRQPPHPGSPFRNVDGYRSSVPPVFPHSYQHEDAKMTADKPTAGTSRRPVPSSSSVTRDDSVQQDTIEIPSYGASTSPPAPL